ncbi:MAG TPA: hypothetical protein VFA43_15915 [Gemmatimonadaceae bacterium]|nr:hypothetical protein [Gemmatimonadaceae bacterium]
MSDEPKAIYRDWDATLKGARAPTGRWTEVEEALYNACMDAAVENWDGYGANAIDPKSVDGARRLLALLPTTFPAPSIGVDADGEVSMTWYGTSGSLFSVSVSPTGELAYAGILGDTRSSGREPIGSRFPADILANLQRLYDHGEFWRTV